MNNVVDNFDRASIPSIQSRHVGIARLHHPANLGTASQEVYFVIVVLTPTKEVRGPQKRILKSQTELQYYK